MRELSQPFNKLKIELAINYVNTNVVICQRVSQAEPVEAPQHFDRLSVTISLKMKIGRIL